MTAPVKAREMIDDESARLGRKYRSELKELVTNWDHERVADAFARALALVGKDATAETLTDAAYRILSNPMLAAHTMPTPAMRIRAAGIARDMKEAMDATLAEISRDQ